MHPQIPQTSFALLSGSAGWGVNFPEDLHLPGVEVLEAGLAFNTPWGVSKTWQLLGLDASITSDGQPRTVLNVFFHGHPVDDIDHSVYRRVGWVLKQAGTRKILTDSTCGSLNRALQPRDYVLPRDFLDLSQTMYSTLPGRFQHLAWGRELVCPSLGRTVETIAHSHWPSPGRVYGHCNGLVGAHSWGPRFETDAEARALAILGGDVINQSMAQEATIAREIGACFVSATYVVTYVAGHGYAVPSEWGDLDTIHEELAETAATISLRAIAEADPETDCDCQRLLAERPARYMRGAPADA